MGLFLVSCVTPASGQPSNPASLRNVTKAEYQALHKLSFTAVGLSNILHES